MLEELLDSCDEQDSLAACEALIAELEQDRRQIGVLTEPNFSQCGSPDNQPNMTAALVPTSCHSPSDIIPADDTNPDLERMKNIMRKGWLGDWDDLDTEPIEQMMRNVMRRTYEVVMSEKPGVTWNFAALKFMSMVKMACNAMQAGQQQQQNKNGSVILQSLRTLKVEM